jgi:hypothetical protein
MKPWTSNSDSDCDPRQVETQVIVYNFAMIPACRLRGPSDIDWVKISSQIRAKMLALRQNDEYFTSASTRGNQCYHACRVLREGRTLVVLFAVIGRILGVNKETVTRHYKRYLHHPDGQSHPERPPILVKVQCEELVHEIELAYTRGRAMTMSFIQEYLRTYFHLLANKTTLAELLERDARVKSCSVIPTETAQQFDPSQRATWIPRSSQFGCQKPLLLSYLAAENAIAPMGLPSCPRTIVPRMQGRSLWLSASRIM